MFKPDTQSSFKPDTRNLSGFVGNIGESGRKFIGDTASAILNPVQTVKGIISLVKDPMVLVNYYKDRYGKDLAQTLYEDPVGVLADLSTLVGGAGAVLKGVDAVSDIGRLGKIADVVSDVGRVIDPLSIAGKGVQKIVSPVSTIAGKGIKQAGSFMANASENIATAGLGSPKKLTAVKKLSNMPIDEFFDKYNLWDRSPESVQSAIDVVSKQRGGMIDSSVAKVKVKDIIASFNDEIERLRPSTIESDVALQQLNELTRRRDNFVTAMRNPETSRSKRVVSAKRINESQKLVGGDVRSTAFTPGASMTGSGQGTKKTYELFRKQTEKAVPGTQKLGREEAALIKLKELTENANSRASARQNINFSKLGGATVAGATFRSVPAAIGGFVAEQFVNSPAGSRILSKSLKNVGSVLKESKTPDLSKFNKITPFYKAGKVGRMISPKTNQEQQSLQPVVSPQKSVSQPIITPKPITGEVKVKSTGYGGKNPFKRTKKVKKGSFV